MGVAGRKAGPRHVSIRLIDAAFPFDRGVPAWGGYQRRGRERLADQKLDQRVIAGDHVQGIGRRAPLEEIPPAIGGDEEAPVNPAAGLGFYGVGLAQIVLRQDCIGQSRAIVHFVYSRPGQSTSWQHGLPLESSNPVCHEAHKGHQLTFIEHRINRLFKVGESFEDIA